MSYCTLCQRHLNGALSCPGCGRPQEALPQQEPERPVPAAPTAAPAPRRARRRTSRRRGALVGLVALGAAAGGLATAVVAFGEGDGSAVPLPPGGTTASASVVAPSTR
ncbi:hypothetical protein ACFXPX_33030, partial [Kitasatospora sp. NPDC059146]